jgi:hypothetical protein
MAAGFAPSVLLAEITHKVRAHDGPGSMPTNLISSRSGTLSWPVNNPDTSQRSLSPMTCAPD